MMKFEHWLPNLLTNLLPNQKINAIVLFKVVYFREERLKTSEKLIRHEKTHIKQQNNEGLLFYFKYVTEYFTNLIKYKNHYKSYRNISYEIEARAAEKIVE